MADDSTSLFSASNYFTKVLPDVLANRKKTLVAQRSKKVDDISKLATSYLELEELLEIEEKIGSDSAVNARKTKMYNIATLINSITSEIQLIDKWCENRVGQNCETPTCYGKFSDGPQPPCGGHGTCTDVDTCVCKEGYLGSECSEYSCYGISITNKTGICSGNGACVSYNVCNCKVGFYGSQCQNTYYNGSIQMQSNFIRRLSDPSIIPKSCKDYLQYYYVGDTGNGLYLVRPKNTSYVVYCDMDNGGYTLLNSLLSASPSADLNSYTDSIKLSTLVSSSALRDFKGTYTNVKNSGGNKCITDTLGINLDDQILTYLCQPIFSSAFSDSSFSQIFFLSNLKYWFF